MVDAVDAVDAIMLWCYLPAVCTVNNKLIFMKWWGFADFLFGQGNRQTDQQAHGQTGRHMDRQTDRHTDGQTGTGIST